MAMGNVLVSDTSVTTQGHVLDHLQQLLDCTGQLALCEENPAMEIAPLADSCNRHLLALQQTISCMANQEGAPPTMGEFVRRNLQESEKMREKLQTLIDQTDHCIAALRRRLEGTAQELASLRSSQTAIRAYRNR
jgi:hypothetical protein